MRPRRWFRSALLLRALLAGGLLASAGAVDVSVARAAEVSAPLAWQVGFS